MHVRHSSTQDHKSFSYNNVNNSFLSATLTFMVDVHFIDVF